MKNLINKYDETMQTLARLHLTMHDKKYKMEGLQSISTSVLENPICQARRKVPGSVCAKCYAQHLTAYRKGLRDCLVRNYDILNSHLLSPEEALRTRFDTRYARIESFGDVASVTHARNYIRIIRANEDVNFGIWTKNTHLWKQAFDLEGKPENTTFVISSMNLNQPDEIPEELREYVDHIFTVWTPDRYIYKDTPSECAGIKCRTCLKCYKRNGQLEINEKLR